MTTNSDNKKLMEGRRRTRSVIKAAAASPFQTRLTEKFYVPFDLRSKSIQGKLAERQYASKPGIQEKQINARGAIENRLVDNDVTLQVLLDNGMEMMTNVRVAMEKMLEQRRLLQHKEDEELQKIMDNEAIVTQQKLASITEQWSELNSEDNNGIRLAELLNRQKDRIAELVKEKDFVIEKHRDDLKHATVVYEDYMDQQYNDSHFLLDRMNSNVEQLRKSYAKQIELLYNTLEDERDTLFLAGNQKWEQLSDRINENIKMKQQIEKEKREFYDNELDRIKMEHIEKTREIRIQLENDFDVVQLELYNLKEDSVRYCEKFHYNYEILQKKCDENVLTRNQEKRRLAKLRDQVETLRKQINDTRTNFENDSKKTVKEIVRLHSNFLELERRADRDAFINNQKFEKIWEINVEEATNLLNELFAIGKVFDEQQLGLDWEPPELMPYKINQLKSYRHAQEILYPGQSQPTSLKALAGSIHRQSRQNEMILPRIHKDNVADDRIVRLILRKLAGETGFLIESKLKRIIDLQTGENAHNRYLIELNTVFEALGITHLRDISSLIDFCMPYAWCPNCQSSEAGSVGWIQKMGNLEYEGSVSSRSSVMEEASFYHTMGSSLVSICDLTDMDTYSVDTVLASHIREFSNENTFNRAVKSIFPLKTDELCEIPKETPCDKHYLVIESGYLLKILQEYTVTYLNQNGDGESVTTMNQRLSKVRHTTARLLAEDDIKKFWMRFVDIFGPNKQQLWNCLEQGLNVYLKILKKRDTLDTECEYLRRQNAELRHLLSKFSDFEEPIQETNYGGDCTGKKCKK